MKNVRIILVVLTLGILALSAQAQEKGKSCLRVGFDTGLLNDTYYPGAFAEYAYSVTPWFSAGLSFREEASRHEKSRRADELSFSQNVVSVMLHGYFKPGYRSSFWERLEVGLGLGYERFFEADLKREYLRDIYDTMEFNSFALDGALRFCLYQNGRIEFGLDANYIICLGESPYYAARAGLHFGVNF